MKSVYNNAFLEIYIDIEKSLIFDIWKKESEQMLLEDFETFLNDYLAIAQTYQPMYALSDNRKMRLTLVPTLQIKAKNNKMLLMTIGLIKHAIILPNDDIGAQVSVYQLIKELEKVTDIINVKGFENLKDAEDWLFY